jgi:mRNA interferase RelE/StbE
MSRRPRKVRTPDAVAGLIRHLHPQIKRKLRAALEQLAKEPHSGKPLKDKLSGLWSFRVGKFRVVYRINRNGAVELVAFGGRATIYEETYRLIARDTRGRAR